MKTVLSVGSHGSRDLDTDETIYAKAVGAVDWLKACEEWVQAVCFHWLQKIPISI